ncbi:MAG: thioredoxin [Bacteroidales bacterium]|jgi:thioredoxin 1|nr:thioredoxin [Bacteroidales bacterium]
MEVEVTDTNFDQVVLQSDKPVMIDLWAEWCGPCRVIAPFVHEIAEEYQGKIVVGKMDVDENTQIPAKYGVRNIPTILFFKNGKLVDKQVGAVPKHLLVGKIEALLK